MPASIHTKTENSVLLQIVKCEQNGVCTVAASYNRAIFAIKETLKTDLL
jgi:hypothetical protein